MPAARDRVLHESRPKPIIQGLSGWYLLEFETNEFLLSDVAEQGQFPWEAALKQ